MALEVIGAGFGRTGTLSMKAALEQLGYEKCHHMVEVLMPRDQTQLKYWDDIGRGEPADWPAVFEGYKACVDFPASIYWRELADAFPDAKVVLTVRDFDGWYKSASDTIYKVDKTAPKWTRLIPKPRKMSRMVNNIVWGGKFGGRFEDKAHARKVFEDHIADVKAALPSERLLVFQVREGWQPLCAFLGKPVPADDFPRLNDTAEFTKLIRTMTRLQYVPFAIAGAILLAIGAYFAFH